MKKILLAMMLITSAAQAYLGSIHPYEPNPYEPNPHYPGPSYPSYPPHSGYSDYGPGRTYRWVDMGAEKIDKVVTETIHIRAGDRLVNEILLRSTSADTEIVRAHARLSNGRTLRLSSGVVKEKRDVRVRLDRHYSVRVDSIVIEATSRSLVGSRARLQIWLGLAE